MARKASQYHHGDMDIHEQVSTFHLVMNITKWGSLVLAAALLALVLWFCTSAGFLARADRQAREVVRALLAYELGDRRGARGRQLRPDPALESFGVGRLILRIVDDRHDQAPGRGGGARRGPRAVVAHEP